MTIKSIFTLLTIMTLWVAPAMSATAIRSDAGKINGASVPANASIVGTNASGQIVNQSTPSFLYPQPSAITTVSVSGSYTVSVSASTLYLVTLTGNITELVVNTPSTQYASFSLLLKQGGSGGYTVLWPVSFDWGESGEPVLTTTASKVDAVRCVTYSAGSRWLCGVSAGFSGY